MSSEFPFEHFLKPSIKDINLNSFSDIPKTKSIQNFSDEELEKLNKNILEALKELLPEQKFNTFFKNTFSLAVFSNEKMEFSASTLFIKNMVEEYHSSQLKEAIFSCLGKEYQISITAKKKVTPQTEASSSEDIAKSRTLKDASFNLSLSPSQEDILSSVQSKYINHVRPKETGAIVDTAKNFDNFIVGPSNQMAYATTQAVAQRPGKAYPCLYMHANSGLGKTHLLHAIANKINKLNPSKTIALLSARDFSDEMVKALWNKKIATFRRKYSQSIDILMIDDIHELKGKEATQNEFFHIFNELHSKDKQLVFTSDRPPQEISGVPERITSRLQWGLVVDIQKPDIETRIAILKSKANELDVFVPDNAIQYIASNIKTNIRELEGVLIKLSAYADVMKMEIDMEMAREQLNFLNTQQDKENLKLENIIKAVSKHFKLPVASIKSRLRAKRISYARRIAIYLFREWAGASQREIGEYFSNRKHTTIRYAIGHITEEIKNNPETLKDISSIENSLEVNKGQVY